MSQDPPDPFNDEPSGQSNPNDETIADGSTAGDSNTDETIADDAASAPAASPHPKFIGEYRVLAVLGMGGMGIVYKAQQDRPNRTVAIKVIRSGLNSDKFLRRFELEAEAHGRLNHPGIAQIFELGRQHTNEGELPYFVMEYIQGTPLTLWAEKQKLSERGRLEILARICDAVQHAHQRGVIHRDLKPDNILVDASGQPKILDFGLARATDSDLQVSTILTNPGLIMGTLPYMAPEQAMGANDAIDTRCDIYALGVIAYELLTGKLPIDLKGRILAEAVRLIQEQEPPRMSLYRPSLRGDIETLVGKALAKEKDRRYTAASELASDIRKYLADEPISARPPSNWYVLGKFAKRNKALFTGIMAVLMALVFGVVGTTYGLIRANEANILAEQRRQIAEDALASEQVQRERAESESRRALQNYGRALQESAEVAFERSQFNQGHVFLSMAAEIMGHQNNPALVLQHTIHPSFPLFGLETPIAAIQATTPDGYFGFYTDGNLVVRFAFDSGIQVLSAPLPFRPMYVKSNDEGTKIAACDNLGNMALVQFPEGNLIGTVKLRLENINNLNYILMAFSATSQHLFAHYEYGETPNKILVYDAETFAQRGYITLPEEAQGQKFAMEVSGDGALLAVSVGHTVHLYRTGDFSLFHSFVPSGIVQHPVFSIAISSDNRRLAAANGSVVVLYSIPQNKQEFTLDVGDRHVNTLGFIEKNRFLVYGNFRGGSGVISMCSSKVLTTFPTIGKVMVAPVSGQILAGQSRIALSALADLGHCGYEAPLFPPDMHGRDTTDIPPEVSDLLKSLPPLNISQADMEYTIEGRNTQQTDGPWIFYTNSGRTFLFDPKTRAVRMIVSNLPRTHRAVLLKENSILLRVASAHSRAIYVLERHDLTSGSISINHLPHAPIGELAFVLSPDERTFALSHVNNQVGVYRTDDLSLIGTLNQPDQNPRQIQTEPSTGALLIRDNDRIIRRVHLDGLLDRKLASYEETSKKMGYAIDGMSVVPQVP